MQRFPKVHRLEVSLHHTVPLICRLALLGQLLHQEARTTVLHRLAEAVKEMRSAENISKTITIAHRIFCETNISNLSSRIPRIRNRIIRRGKQDPARTGSTRATGLIDVSSLVRKMIWIAN